MYNTDILHVDDCIKHFRDIIESAHEHAYAPASVFFDGDGFNFIVGKVTDQLATNESKHSQAG